MGEKGVEPKEVAAPLIRWFLKNQRQMPWREERSAYRTWVSEVMLQQTRVSTVIPYFEKFMEKFPTVKDLAKADLSEVLALWSGLGYYRRARALHAGASDVVEYFEGEIPSEVDKLMKLRGVGQYTAGAISSIAYGKREPLVDGNVIRVLTRLFAIEGDPAKGPIKKKIWSMAEQCLPEENAGVFNESLMELGALVCTPSSPNCTQCPLATHCAAYAQGKVTAYPQLAPKKKPPVVYAAALVDKQVNEIRLARRRGDALFGGMWEPPLAEGKTADEAKKELEQYAELDSKLGLVKHVLSHREMQIAVYSGTLKKEGRYPETYDKTLRVAEKEFENYGISTLAKKVMKIAPTIVLAWFFSSSTAKADPSGAYVHALATTSIGTAFRFNNPYRLERPLGSSAESVSQAATYFDVGAAAFFRLRGAWQHGPHLHWSTALDGITQDVWTPSYAFMYRPSSRASVLGRVGAPIVTGPDANVGFEAAVSGQFFFLTSIGVTAEMGYSGYYGAATREVSATLIPIMYGQAGIVIDWEFLP